VQEIPLSTLFILSLAALISLVTTFVNRLLTDPEKMKAARKEASEWNKQLREARRNNDKKATEKLMKKQQYIMQLQSKMMWQSMKVSLLFLVPLFLMWQVLGSIYQQTPIAYFPGLGPDLPIPIFSNSLIWWYLVCSMLFGTAFQHAFKMIEISE
jgi:uncharacterized membrane protein (DUF106 family)